MSRVEFRVPVHVEIERTDFGQAPTVRRPYGLLRRLLEFGPFLLALESGAPITVLDVSPRLLELVRKARSAARRAAILAGVARAT